MNRLKKQFIIYFLILATTVSLLLYYSYKQVNKEEQNLWASISETVYNQMQASISDFLIEEDSRNFNEYRYYYVPESQVNQNYILNVSPLATIPSNNHMGLIGYFQVDPDGSFHTPYLPKSKSYKGIRNINERKNLESTLIQITESFHNKITKPKDKWVDLSTFIKKSDRIMAKPKDGYAMKKKSRKKLYPNPIKQTISNFSKSSGSSIPAAAPEVDSEDAADDLDLSIAQVQTFQTQNFEPLIEEKTVEGEDKKTSLLIDPFRARLVDNKNIIFYRKVWLDKQMYVQGFVVALKQFYRSLEETSFNNSRLTEFAKANILIGNWSLKELTQMKTLFSRSFGYPLTQVSLEIGYNKLPSHVSRLLLHILASILLIMITIGLYLIYKTAASQVLLSLKRQDFVSAVTHELKTPLTSIRMYSEMLNDGWAENDDKKKEYYKHISNESSRLSGMIDNVLQLARLEKKSFSFNLVNHCPSKELKNMCPTFKSLAEKNGFTWEDNIEDNLPVVTYDPDAIKQILFTLIDNSIKFTKGDNKKISLSANKSPYGVEMSLSDNGPGVSNSELSKIFNNFYRTENELTRQTKGTGIGLAMAKMLAEGMGAQISAKNNQNSGLTVLITFKSA